jgi:hypothetical protein
MINWLHSNSLKMGNKYKLHYSDILSAASLGNFNDFKKVHSPLKSLELKKLTADPFRRGILG